MKRLLQHALTGRWHIHRLLSAESKEQITASVAEAEQGHSGQIRVVIEATPGVRRVLHGRTARERLFLLRCTLMSCLMMLSCVR